MCIFFVEIRMEIYWQKMSTRAKKEPPEDK